MEITRTIDTTASLDKVFAYLSDFTTSTEWDPGTVETKLVSGTGGVGTSYHNTSKFLGRETELVYTVQKLVPDNLLVLEGNNQSVRATDTMTFAATATGTRVVYHAEFAFKGVVKLVAPLLAPVLSRAFKKLGDEAEVTMKSCLDKL